LTTTQLAPYVLAHVEDDQELVSRTKRGVTR
jgi:hypothetical protein